MRIIKLLRWTEYEICMVNDKCVKNLAEKPKIYLGDIDIDLGEILKRA